MEEIFKIYTRGIIFDKSNNILIIKKRSNQKLGGGEWLLPGGTVEFGENIEESLIREIKEETNLEIKELELLSTKKIIIGNSHWLGIYFTGKVKNENEVSNIEYDKHETICFFNYNDIPEMKDYIVIKLLSNFSNEYFDIKTVNYQQHSMQKHLFKYIENKVHSLIKENQNSLKYIKIVGNYDRSNIISKEEKNDKQFNFKRPTAYIDGDTIYISCFPGEDYIKHYANIIGTYFYINNLKSPLISYKLPNINFIYKTFSENGIEEIPNCDTIIFGNIDKIGLLNDIQFLGKKDFKFKIGNINGKKVMLLGCKFSIWGNTGKHLIDILTKTKKFNKFIYVGKLGILNLDTKPNEYIATGNTSYINGNTIKWNNIFNDLKYNNIIYGKHITCYSVIEETIDYIHKNKIYGDFIDPEIGNMAQSCINNGKEFSYLHIISDNVIIPHEENLSNERKKEIIEKRNKLFLQIGNIIKSHI